MWANETKQHVLPQVTTGMGSLYLMENCFLCCYQFEINLCCGHKKVWHADRNLQECELIIVEPFGGRARMENLGRPRPSFTKWGGDVAS